MGCRKNLSRLTAAERHAFTNAVNQLRVDGGYDTYVRQHEGAMGHGHGGPAFFPWHREYLRRFERDLQAIDQSVSIPYWNWTDANVNASGTESLIWRDDFMGGPGAAGTGAVTTGPFAGWGLIRNSFNIFGFPGGGGSVASLMASPDYTTFRGIENVHGAAHTWVGGFVGNASISPRDPVFWLIHSNVDRLWAEWVNQHRSSAGFQPFLPLAGGPQGHSLNDLMWPWNGAASPFGVLPWTVVPEPIRPADRLDHRALGYRYDTIDSECRPTPPPPPQRPCDLMRSQILGQLKVLKDLSRRMGKATSEEELEQLTDQFNVELAELDALYADFRAIGCKNPPPRRWIS